jgi:hypothetical protein
LIIGAVRNDGTAAFGFGEIRRTIARSNVSASAPHGQFLADSIITTVGYSFQ